MAPPPFIPTLQSLAAACDFGDLVDIGRLRRMADDLYLAGGMANPFGYVSKPINERDLRLSKSPSTAIPFSGSCAKANSDTDGSWSPPPTGCFFSGFPMRVASSSPAGIQRHSLTV